MKNIFFMLAAVVTLTTACTGTKGYMITGTLQGATDGDKIFLAQRPDRQYVFLDSATIVKGEFQLKGAVDTTALYYLYSQKDRFAIPVILEKGNIIATISNKGNDSITGTPQNDALTAVRLRLNSITESDEAHAQALRAELAKHVHSLIGFYLLRTEFYYLPYPEIGEYISQLPAGTQKEPYMVKLKQKVETSKLTAPGQHFTDLAMKTPEGKDIKLSDYLGKGKYVLVDFWASWCPPCRAEMPKLVDMYKKYAGKNFEIVGISFDKTEDKGGLESWKKGIKDLNITWPQMSDLKYWDSEGAKVYAVSSIPHLMLVDKDGTIMARNLNADQAAAKLAELIK